MAAAQQAGKFADEIVPMKTRMKVVDKATKDYKSIVDYEGDARRVQSPRRHRSKAWPASSRCAGPATSSPPATPRSSPTWGRGRVVVMEAKEAERRGLEPLGLFKGWAVAGCQPDEIAASAWSSPCRASWNAMV